MSIVLNLYYSKVDPLYIGISIDFIILILKSMVLVIVNPLPLGVDC